MSDIPLIFYKTSSCSCFYSFLWFETINEATNQFVDIFVTPRHRAGADGALCLSNDVDKNLDSYYTRRNLTTCNKSADKLSTRCVRTACPKLSTSSFKLVDNL